MNGQVKGVVSDQRSRHRYEISTEAGRAGFLDYRESSGLRDLLHTEVDPKFEGQGLAAQLVQGALDDARAAGHKIVPSCSYVAKFVERHPEYQDLVSNRD